MLDKIKELDILMYESDDGRMSRDAKIKIQQLNKEGVFLTCSRCGKQNASVRYYGREYPLCRGCNNKI